MALGPLSLFKRFIFLFFLITQPILSESQDDLLNLLRIPFPEIIENKINLSLLEGGRSESKIYKVEFNNKSYVLRLNEKDDKIKNQREFFAHMEASKKQIAPYIHYVSEDSNTMIMDYIEGETFNKFLARKPENIIKMARVLRKVHDLPRNFVPQTSAFERMQNFYKILHEKELIFPALDAAVMRASSLKKEIEGFSIPHVTVHGDLHPHNILFSDKGIILIDWAESGYEDPFYDLTCFALCHDYHAEEDNLLLTHYLGHAPTKDQKARYELYKRMDYLYFAVELFFVAHQQATKEGVILQKDAPILDWSFYSSKFEKKETDLSSQFFYDFGCCALKNFYLSF